jgi:thiamine-phosphate pyrophosphorylase
MSVNITQTTWLRIVDANCNRAKEGARVCEDICRFVLNDEDLCGRWKAVRHGITEALQDYAVPSLLESRDIAGDVGRGSIASEFQRLDIRDIFYANAQRVKESVRVLEELLKLDRPQAAQRMKEIRYDVYSVEKDTSGKLSAISDT